MSDPQVEQNALEAESQLKAAQADYDNLKAQLESQLLAQQAQVTAAESQSEQAKLQAEADEQAGQGRADAGAQPEAVAPQREQLFKQADIEGER